MVMRALALFILALSTAVLAFSDFAGNSAPLLWLGAAATLAYAFVVCATARSARAQNRLNKIRATRLSRLKSLKRLNKPTQAREKAVFKSAGGAPKQHQ